MDVRETIKMLSIKRKELKEKERILLEESEEMFLKMDELVDSGKFSDEEIKDKWEECYSKEDILIEKRKAIKEEITDILKTLYELRKVMDTPSKLEGKNVDLYKVGLESYCYSICLHGTKEVIGDIKYRGELDEISTLSTGNIGYYIAKQYRGNGYVSEALQILSDKLYEEGISTIYIAVKPDNIASRRVAEKFGGKIMQDVSSEFSIVYKCDLNKIKKSNKR